jgi:hypothetical protein
MHACLYVQKTPNNFLLLIGKLNPKPKWLTEKNENKILTFDSI